MQGRMGIPMEQEPVTPAAPATNSTVEVDMPQEVDMTAITANDTSPPTELQLLNILASKQEGFVNPSGILDTTGLFDRLPSKHVGRRSVDGHEFGCQWPGDMAFWGPEYESQSAFCK